jgi:aspartate/methionine/tyrosine aminotransferase
MSNIKRNNQPGRTRQERGGGGRRWRGGAVGGGEEEDDQCQRWRALSEAGFAVPDYSVTPGGGFFIFARITPELRAALPPERMEEPFNKNPAAPGGTARLDWALCQWMAEERGVLCIPLSPFFSEKRAREGASDEFIRVAFCKEDVTIERAAGALMGLRRGAPEVEEEEEEVGNVDVVAGSGLQ